MLTPNNDVALVTIDHEDKLLAFDTVTREVLWDYDLNVPAGVEIAIREDEESDPKTLFRVPPE